jgi:hypothetical protein
MFFIYLTVAGDHPRTGMNRGASSNVVVPGGKSVQSLVEQVPGLLWRRTARDERLRCHCPFRLPGAIVSSVAGETRRQSTRTRSVEHAQWL